MGEDERQSELREIACFQRDFAFAHLGKRPAPARVDGRAGGEAFKAVGMEGAVAAISVIRVAADRNVTHLVMACAGANAAFMHDACAYAGANRDIGERFLVPARAIDVFGEAGAGDVALDGEGCRIGRHGPHP